MPVPIGVNQDGGLVFTLTSEEVRAVKLFAQLEAWREKGYDPQLWGTPRGWGLILDTTKWGMRDPNERNDDMVLRFNTPVCATPEDAIDAALRVVQP